MDKEAYGEKIFDKISRYSQGFVQGKEPYSGALVNPENGVDLPIKLVDPAREKIQKK